MSSSSNFLVATLGGNGNVDRQHIAERVRRGPIAGAYCAGELVDQWTFHAEFLQPSRHREGDLVGAHSNGSAAVETIGDLVDRCVPSSLMQPLRAESAHDMSLCLSVATV
jgi:hypothetical protein